MWKNLFKTFLGSGFSVILGLIVLPFYLSELGAEQFGIYAISSTIVALMVLADGGFSKLLSREVSLFRSGEIEKDTLVGFVNALTAALFILSIVVLMLGSTFAETISDSWLNAELLSSNTVAYSIQLIFLVASIRLLLSLPTEGLVGAECHDWLFKYNIVFTALRHIGGLVVVVLFKDVVCFLLFDAALSLVKWLVFYVRFRSVLPYDARRLFSFKVDGLKSRLRLGGAIGLSGLLSAFVRQSDRILFSGLLSLEFFSYYAIAAQVSSGILLLIQPVIQVWGPRLVTVIKSPLKVREYYLQGCETLLLLVLPVSVVLVLLPELLLFSWLGEAVAPVAADYLRLLALANLFVCLSVMLRPLQVAYGKMRLHLSGSIVFSILRIPTIIYFGSEYGAEAALYGLLALNAAYFFLWNYLVHKVFLPGFNTLWMSKSLFAMCLTFGPVAIFCNIFSDVHPSRLLSFVICALVGLSALAVIAMSVTKEHPVVVEVVRRTRGYLRT